MPKPAEHRRTHVGLIACGVLIAAGIAGFVVLRKIEQRQWVISEIKAAGGDISFSRPADPLRRTSRTVDCTTLDFLTSRIDEQWLRDHEMLRDCPLDRLFLDGASLSEESVAEMLRIHPLEFFQGVRVTVSESAAEELADNRRIRTLILQDSQLSDAAFRKLPLEQLEMLWIAGSGVTPAGLSELRRCPRRVSLVLDGTQLDQAASEILRDKETALKLIGPQVTDEHLRWLKPAFSISVGLDDTSVTAEGIADFRSEKPGRPVYVNGNYVVPRSQTTLPRTPVPQPSQ